MRAVLDTIRKQTHKCITLQEIASSNKVSFVDAQKIRKTQDYEYKKLQWLKNIHKAMEEQERKELEEDGRKTSETRKPSERY